MMVVEASNQTFGFPSKKQIQEFVLIPPPFIPPIKFIVIVYYMWDEHIDADLTHDLLSHFVPPLID